VLALDVDGVLLDPELGGEGTWQEVLGRRHGIDTTLLDEAFFIPHWADIVVGRKPIEPVLSEVVAELGWPLTGEQFLSEWMETDCAIDQAVVAEALGWAGDGARLVLATNQEHRRAAHIRARLAAVLPVSDMAYSAALGCTKADHQFYRLAGDQFGVPRRSGTVVFVDDADQNIKVALESGWSGVHFIKSGTWRDSVQRALDVAVTLR
jgi:putative hydrolase of the HAD superfamily